eukprot:GHRQ01006204.1.p2 GENE.GHRQ01006204.1~~GHRQ01006204.1.p2  ORF type:complete len:164 (+),score=33.20 GHRQ01006204.1:268-759(+)
MSDCGSSTFLQCRSAACLSVSSCNFVLLNHGRVRSWSFLVLLLPVLLYLSMALVMAVVMTHGGKQRTSRWRAVLYRQVKHASIACDCCKQVHAPGFDFHLHDITGSHSFAELLHTPQVPEIKPKHENTAHNTRITVCLVQMCAEQAAGSWWMQGRHQVWGCSC